MASWSFAAAATAGLGGGLWLFRRYANGGVCHSNARLDGKTAIVTGANCGIGKETACDFAKRGARVILACRNVASAKTAIDDIRLVTSSGELVAKQLDLASLESVRSFAKDVLENEKKVHILVNNAGVMMCPYWKTEEGFEMHFGANHLGHFLLTHLLMERMKESWPSRIVIVSSSLHKHGKLDFDDLNMEKSYDSLNAYKSSKLANALYSRELAKRLVASGVNVYCLHPGVVWTKLGRHFEKMMYKVVNLAMLPLAWLIMKTPWHGAQTSIYCAVSEELNGKTGRYYSDCQEQPWSTAALDDEAAKKLWEKSERLVGIVPEKD